MKNKIYILFDCPEKTNDKKWLHEELLRLHGNGVVCVPIKRKLHRMLEGNIAEKIHGNMIILWQCVRAIFLSRQDDVFITWSRRTGLFLNALLVLLKRKNKLITMNWLTPKIKKNMFLEKMVFGNPNARIIVNSSESINEWNTLMHNDKGNVHLVPDVYDNDTVFMKKRIEGRYCFTGGYNNRDWNVVRKLAEKFTSIDFVCVANKDDFESFVDGQIPQNMNVCFDIAPDKYYKLMQNSFAVLLPLRDKSVAGLINIVKSASYGTPCLITKNVSTAQYYKDDSILLVDPNDFQSWQMALERLLKLDEISYLNVCTEFSGFIQRNFAPQRAAEKIYHLVNGT